MSRKPRVLLVEDQEAIVHLLQIILKDSFEVTVAQSLGELQTQLSDPDVDFWAIVLDGHMEVRAQHPPDTLPFISLCRLRAQHVIATSCDDQARQLMLLAGCTADCEKSVIHNHLFKLLETTSTS